MKQFREGDLAVVTGPLKLAASEKGLVFLDPGDVVEVVLETDDDGDVLVCRRSDGKHQFIDTESLAPFEEIAEYPRVVWDEIHDYVYEGDDDE